MCQLCDASLILCFIFYPQVEKMLLVYGWGKWNEIVRHGGFRRDLDELDISNISQAIVSIPPTDHES